MAQTRYIALNFSTAGQTLSWVSGANVEASVDGGTTWTDVTTEKSVVVTGTTCLLRAKTGSTPFYGLGCSSYPNLIGVSGHLGALIDYEADDLDYVTVADNQFSKVSLDADGNPDANADQYGLFYCAPSGSWSATCNFTTVKVQLPKSNTIGKWAYAHMFASVLDISGSKTIKQMYLPATTLGVGCYYHMFYNWYSGQLPVMNLPATKLSDHCYNGMFKGSQIIGLPNIHFEWVAPYCCKEMFSTCTILPKIADFTLEPLYLTKQISADGSVLQSRADHCYESMFEGCTAVTYVNPFILSAVDTAPYCYKNMFKGCLNWNTTNTLMTIRLKADYIDEGAYYGMFHNCEKLKYVYISATACYQVDTHDSDHETKAPLGYMFAYCHGLNKVICYLKYGGPDKDHLVENGFRDLNPVSTENYTTFKVDEGGTYSSRHAYIPQSTYDTWVACQAGGTSSSSILGKENYWVN